LYDAKITHAIPFYRLYVTLDWKGIYTLSSGYSFSLAAESTKGLPHWLRFYLARPHGRLCLADWSPRRLDFNKWPRAIDVDSGPLMVRFATRATGGQFVVATSSYSMGMVVRPLLTFKHPRGSCLHLCSHSITSLVVKYLGWIVACGERAEPLEQALLFLHMELHTV